MLRVLGLDPGTISLDCAELVDGQIVDQWTLPTAEALADPRTLVARLSAHGPPDLIAGPSGYGLPLVKGRELSEEALALALLPDRASPAGLGGLGQLMRLLGSSGLPVVFTPGVIHLDSVPRHRKLNRVDLGTADKVAVAAFAIADQAMRRSIPLTETAFILLDLGGAFSAALAVLGGRIVDGLGGTAGPIGWQSGGAWDGEVAFLNGGVRKGDLFRGGVESALAAGIPRATVLEAYAESAAKAVQQMLSSAPGAVEIVLTGRHASTPEVADRLRPRLASAAPTHLLEQDNSVKAGAVGAAYLADGLAGGRHGGLVEAMKLRACRGSVLDHLISVSMTDATTRVMRP